MGGQSRNCNSLVSSFPCLSLSNSIKSVRCGNSFRSLATTLPRPSYIQSRELDGSNSNAGSMYVDFFCGLHTLFGTSTFVDPSGCRPHLANFSSSSVADDAANEKCGISCMVISDLMSVRCFVFSDLLSVSFVIVVLVFGGCVV